jgi:phage replication-related protein YjqB (UPF0714/DUF867 family)
MADRYTSFEDLAKAEVEGQDYQVRLRNVEGGRAVIIAPHGGGIEPGTSEIADAIADNDFSFYAFEGLKAWANGPLHVTSTDSTSRAAWRLFKRRRSRLRFTERRLWSPSFMQEVDTETS